MSRKIPIIDKPVREISPEEFAKALGAERVEPGQIEIQFCSVCKKDTQHKFFTSAPPRFRCIDKDHKYS